MPCPHVIYSCIDSQFWFVVKMEVERKFSMTSELDIVAVWPSGLLETESPTQPKERVWVPESEVAKTVALGWEIVDRYEDTTTTPAGIFYLLRSRVKIT